MRWSPIRETLQWRYEKEDEEEELERKVHWLASNASTVARWATWPATAGSRAGRDDMKVRVATRENDRKKKKKKQATNKEVMVTTDELVVHIVEALRRPTGLRARVPLRIPLDGSRPPEPMQFGSHRTERQMGTKEKTTTGMHHTKLSLGDGFRAFGVGVCWRRSEKGAEKEEVRMEKEVGKKLERSRKQEGEEEGGEKLEK